MKFPMEAPLRRRASPGPRRAGGRGEGRAPIAAAAGHAETAPPAAAEPRLHYLLALTRKTMSPCAREHLSDGRTAARLGTIPLSGALGSLRFLASCFSTTQHGTARHGRGRGSECCLRTIQRVNARPRPPCPQRRAGASFPIHDA